MAFDPNMSFNGSKVDLARQLIHGDALPRERAPYILARVALSQLGDNTSLAREIYDRAFELLSDDQEQIYLQPELPEDLRLTIKGYVEHKKTSSAYPSKHEKDTLDTLGTILLAAVVDHGSKETVKKIRVASA